MRNFIFIVILQFSYSNWFENTNSFHITNYGSTAKSLSQSTYYNYSKFTSYFQITSSYSQYFDKSFVELKNVNNHFLISYYGVPNIHDTVNAWEDSNSDGTPTSGEIDYSNINTFNFEEVGITFPLQFWRGDFRVWPSVLFSNLHDSHSFHFSFMLEKHFNLKNHDVKISVHDAVSIKRWTTDSWEFFYPSLQLNSVYSFSKIKLYGEFIQYRFRNEFGIGIKIDLHEKLSLLGGYSSNNSTSYGISFMDKHIALNVAFLPFLMENPFLPEQELSIIFNIDSFFKTIKSLSP